MNSLLLTAPKLSFARKYQRHKDFMFVLLTRCSWWKWDSLPWYSWKTRRGRGRPDEQQCIVQCFCILKPKEEKVVLGISYLTSPKILFPSCSGMALPYTSTPADRKSIWWQQWSLHSFHMTEWDVLLGKILSAQDRLSPGAIQRRERLKLMLRGSELWC